MINRARAAVVVAVTVAVAVTLWALWWMAAPHEQEHPAVETRARPAAEIMPVMTPPQAAPAIAAVAVAASATPASLAVVVTGVAVGSDGRNLALVSIDRRPEMLLRVGDTMPGAATVVHIDDTSMTYRRGGVDFRVSVQAALAAQAGVAMNAPDVHPKTYPGFVAGAPAMARAAGTEPGSGNDAFRQAIEKKLQAIAAGR